MRETPPNAEETILFQAGIGGYAQFRIPSVVVTASGAVLACCEARRTCDDWAVIDIHMRRSLDGGRTWEPERGLVDGSREGKTVNNPVLIAGRGGEVHLLYCVGYARAYVMHSGDDGHTWSAPEELTSVFEAFRADYRWKVIATGPGHGIELSGGRLVVPVWLSDASEWCHGPSVVSVITSDDRGRTWRRGEIVPPGEEILSPNETAAAELDDGSVLLNMRTINAARGRDPSLARRALTRSPDGAAGWSTPRLAPDLPDPACCGAMLRIPCGKSGGRILYSGLAGTDASRREDLALFIGSGDGREWSTYCLLHRGGAAYSDLARASDGRIFCVYERFTAETAYHDLTLASFSLAEDSEAAETKRGKKINETV